MVDCLLQELWIQPKVAVTSLNLEESSRGRPSKMVLVFQHCDTLLDWFFKRLTSRIHPSADLRWPQFSSVIQSCPPFCNPVDCSTPGFPVHHQLLDLTQTHVHHVGDAIQPSHPLLSPSPLTFNLSQHQGLFSRSQFFISGGQSIGISASASVLPMNIQDSFPLGWTGWISLQSKGLSKSLFQNYSSKASILQCSAFFFLAFFIV